MLKAYQLLNEIIFDSHLNSWVRPYTLLSVSTYIRQELWLYKPVLTPINLCAHSTATPSDVTQRLMGKEQPLEKESAVVEDMGQRSHPQRVEPPGSAQRTLSAAGKKSSQGLSRNSASLWMTVVFCPFFFLRSRSVHCTFPISIPGLFMWFGESRAANQRHWLFQLLNHRTTRNLIISQQHPDVMAFGADPEPAPDLGVVSFEDGCVYVPCEGRKMQHCGLTEAGHWVGNGLPFFSPMARS